jgi:hypothetical protein
VKVICIDGTVPSNVWFDPHEAPIEGQTYTLDYVFVAPEGVGCTLVELRRNPSAVRHWGAEAGYHLTRFRPLVTDEQKDADLALFKSWLPHNETEPA